MLAALLLSLGLLAGPVEAPPTAVPPAAPPPPPMAPDRPPAANPAPPPPADRPAVPAQAAGFLGVGTQDLTPAFRTRLGTTAERGAVVMDVVANSAARQAGIQVNDVITHFDGQPVGGTAELRALIQKAAAGQEVAVRYQHGAEIHEAKVKLGNAPATPPGPPSSYFPRVDAFRPPEVLRPAAESTRVQELERKVQELEKRLRDLEQRLGAPPKVENK